MKFHNTFQKNTFIATKIMFFNTKSNDENFFKKNVELGRVGGALRAIQKNVGANDYSPLPCFYQKRLSLFLDNLLGSQDGVVIAELYEIHT